MAERRAGRGHRGGRETQDRRQSRRLSVRQRQGRQAHVHHEGEGGDARLCAGLARDRWHRRRRADRRHAIAGRCRAWASERRGDRQDARGDSGLRCSRSDAADRRRGGGAGRRFSPLRQRESRRGAHREDHERRRGGRAAASWRSRSGFRSNEPEDTKVNGEFAFADAQLRITGRAATYEARRQAVVHESRSQRARPHGGNPRRAGQARR